MVSLPVSYAMSPEAATVRVSVTKVMEKSGDANASDTYLRMAARPTMGGVSGCRTMASSDQNETAFSTSRDFAAASHCASVSRMAASSFARSTAGGAVVAAGLAASQPSNVVNAARARHQMSLRMRPPASNRPKEKRPASLPAVEDDARYRLPKRKTNPVEMRTLLCVSSRKCVPR